MKKSTHLFFVVIIFVFLLTLTSNVFAVGSALSFNGRNQYVLLDAHALDGLSDCTVEYWILIVREDNAASPFSAAASNDNNNEYLHYFEFNGGFRPHIHSEAPENGEAFSISQWFHFAMTRDGQSGDWITYVNGEQVDSGRLGNGSLEVANNGLVLGQDQGQVEGGFRGDLALRGNLDEMRIWSLVRTPEQIRQCAHAQVSINSRGLHAYYTFDEGEGQVLGDATAHNFDGRLGEEDGEDGDDPRWINSSAPIYGGIVEISAEAITFGPIVQDQPTEFIIQIENLSDIDDDFHALEFSFEDEELNPDWLTIEPESGELRAGESVDVIFTANPDGLDLGAYEREVEFEVNASNSQFITMPANMIIVEGIGSLSGTVTDEENGNPIAGALVYPTGNYPYMSITNDEGVYEFETLPAFTYTFVADAAGYEPSTSDETEIADEDNVELDFLLFHAEFAIEPGGIEDFMETDQTVEVPLTLSNDGNFDLTWSMDINFPDVEEVSPWTHLETIPIEETFENDRFGSTIFINDHFYIAAGFRGDEDNMIYVMNREGEVVREFAQHGVSDFGYRDMTWDGELMWGIDRNEEGECLFFGFGTDGNLEQTIVSPINPLRAITWDSDHGNFWACNRTTSVYGIDTDGEIIEEVHRGDERLNIYGLAWFSRDEIGYNLYAFCQNGGFRRQIYRINVDDESDEFEAVQLMHEPVDIEGRAGAATISGFWDANQFVFISMTDRPDNIEIFRIESRSEWLNAEPLEGVIEPGNESEIVVTLNTDGLPAEIQYNGILHFNHNADDGEYNFPVTIFIQGEGGVADLTIPLSMGWNLISANLDPAEDEDDFSDIVAPLVEAGLITMAKDGAGNFYHVGENFDQLGDWQWGSGYWLKMNDYAELTITGELLPWNSPIDLTEGWNTIAYMPHNGVNPAGALRNLGDNLIIVKNDDGQFFIHEFGFSNMAQMEEGRGYQVKINADAELVYSLQGDAGNAIPYEYSIKDRIWINELSQSAVSHSLLAMAGNLVAQGTRIEAYTHDGVLAGRGVADADGKIGIALWGDDPQTMLTEGFISGEEISLRVVHDNSELTLVNLMGNSATWEVNGLGVANIAIKAAPYEFGLGKAYPNPFNSKTIISFTVSNTETVTLKVFDIRGRNIATLATGEYVAGQHKVTWEASDVPSGVYSLYLKSNSGIQTQKVVLLK